MLRRRPVLILKCCFQAIVFAIAATSAASISAKPQNVSDGEMALLPEYCPDTMGFKYGDAYYNTSPRATHWVALMGPGFWAMHHYCWGLINLRRSQSPGISASQRNLMLGEVISDFTYVVKNTAANFVLLPEVLTRIGDAEVQLGNSSSASDSYEQARRLKPDYWPAYAHWAEFLIRAKLLRQAKEIVELGLREAPSSEKLREQFRRLGGDPSTISSRPLEVRQNQPGATAAGNPSKAELAASSAK